MKNNRQLNLLVVCLLSVLVVACDWVDSAGSQGVVPQTEIFLDDAPIGGSIVIQENSTARITASRSLAGDETQSYEWSEDPLDSGNLESCAVQNGFKPTLAASDLNAACTRANDCELSFEAVESDDPTLAEFSLTAPELKASVGLRYALVISNSEQGDSVREFDFCFIAVNEAPDANDDTFVVREGVREVFTTRQTHLLSNDSDDIDDSNDPIRVIQEPIVPPSSAAYFELESDGSFTYESSLTDLRTDQFDSFEYGVTDGLFISSARVTLRIVASNQAPELLGEIPNITGEEGASFVENLALYFTDPEQGNLSYRFDESTPLPANGNYTLTSRGVFRGAPALDDAGTYELTLIVSDGGHDVEARVILTIEAIDIPEDNSEPTFVSNTVFNQVIVLGQSITPITPVFVDPDGDTLSYSLEGDSELPDGVTLDQRTGSITGEPESRIWVRDLRVRATDPYGESALSDPFFIRVR